MNVVINRFPALTKTLKRYDSSAEITNTFMQQASFWATQVEQSLVRRAPVQDIMNPRDRINARYPEYAGPHLRDSMRRQETMADVKPGITTIKALVTSSARHIDWVRFGVHAPASGRIYPRGTASEEAVKPRLVFWWGSPLRWEPKDGLPPGIRRVASVLRPGITEANRFDRIAIDEKKAA